MTNACRADEWFAGKPYNILTFEDFTAEKPAPVVHGTAMFYRDLALEAGNYRPWFRVAEIMTCGCV